MKRYTILDLPTTPRGCHFVECIYNDNACCPNPRLGKYNSDSVCYKWTNKKLLGLLNDIKANNDASTKEGV